MSSYTVLLPLLLLCTSVRCLNWTYNPGCENVTLCGDANMLHVQSNFHQYLWSSERGLSAIVFSGSNPLSVNWTQYHQNKTAVTTKTPSSLGLTFKSLYLENSTHHNQTVDLTAPSIRWRALNISTSSGPQLQFSYTTEFMTVMVNVSESNGRMSDKPRMKISENNTLVDITLNLSLVPGIWVSRPNLAHIELEIAPSGVNNTRQTNSKSFDDEEAPALFRYDILQSVEGNSTIDRVYTMWRPVVFADSSRKVISALTPDKINTSAPHVAAPSLLTKYYKKADISSLRLVVSPPDGKENIPDTIYWTLAIGVGVPQSEGLTPLGTILTLVIIGVPSAALILGVAVLAMRRRQSNPGQGYRAI